MSARTVPPVPSWFAGQKLNAAGLNGISTWQNFWANRPMFRMYQAVAQSVPSAAWTQITMDTLDYDTDSGRALGSPWSYTIPVGMSGRWRFTYKTAWTANATGFRSVGLYINGNQATGTNNFTSAVSGVSTFAIGPTETFRVNAGDVINVWGYQSTAGALNTGVGGTPDYSYFEGVLDSLATP